MNSANSIGRWFSHTGPEQSIAFPMYDCGSRVCPAATSYAALSAHTGYSVRPPRSTSRPSLPSLQSPRAAGLGGE